LKRTGSRGKRGTRIERKTIKKALEKGHVGPGGEGNMFAKPRTPYLEKKMGNNRNRKVSHHGGKKGKREDEEQRLYGVEKRLTQVKGGKHEKGSGA